MRKIIVLAVVAVSCAAVAVPAFAATKNVKVGNTGATSDWFISKSKNHGTVTAKKGDTIKWTWAGTFPHNVTVKSGPVKFHSPTQKKGTFSKKLTKAGTYKIFCSIHGATKQSMTIKVS
jgi:plastocyanin